MKMTPELAKRILERQVTRTILTDKQKVDILMDWLEGKTYKELQVKYHVGKSAISNVVVQAKKEAQELLERVAD